MTYLKRAADTFFQSAVQAMRVVAITGPKQVGKSTFVQQHPTLAERPYYSLDDATVLGRVKSDPQQFVLSQPTMTIDEVQREPALILAIKIAVDPPQPYQAGQFVLTGSANLLMMKRVADSLAGRAYYMNLWPLTRRERLGLGTTGIWHRFFEEEPKRWYDIVHDESGPEDRWNELAVRGGFPQPSVGTVSDATARKIWFDGYIDTFIQRDLKDIADIDNVVEFRQVMQMTALRIGNLLNQMDIARDSKVPHTTVRRYLDLLETSYQMIRVNAYTVNRTKRLIKTPKVYWNDSALALALSGGEPGGAHFENMILGDLLVWRDIQSQHTEILYWRTTSGQEVDFVIEHGRQLLPIEIKTTSNPGHRDPANLKLFCEEYGTPTQYGSQASGGLLLHTGPETFWVAKNVLAVPWWRVI